MGAALHFSFTHLLILLLIHPFEIIYGTPTAFQALGFSSCRGVSHNSQQLSFLSLLSLPNLHIHDRVRKGPDGDMYRCLPRFWWSF